MAFVVFHEHYRSQLLTYEIVLIFTGYFLITEPSSSTTWVNGAANLITWSKGLLDGITSFDVELARLSQDGLIFIAKDGEFDGSSAVFAQVA